MELTENKFSVFKKDYPVYGRVVEKDKYLNEQSKYSSEPKCTIHVMWHPITDEASVVAYGEKIQNMLQAVYYGSEDVQRLDHITIAGSTYEIVSIKEFNTYRLLQVSKL